MNAEAAVQKMQQLGLSEKQASALVKYCGVGGLVHLTSGELKAHGVSRVLAQRVVAD